jgi:hypothetical protein
MHLREPEIKWQQTFAEISVCANILSANMWQMVYSNLVHTVPKWIPNI